MMNQGREQESQTRSSRVPQFSSHQEEADWFDTHDMGDYQDQFKTVEVRFAKNLSQGITIRLDAPTLGKLRKEAHAKGIGPTTLARMWILERLSAS